MAPVEPITEICKGKDMNETTRMSISRRFALSLPLVPVMQGLPVAWAQQAAPSQTLWGFTRARKLKPGISGANYEKFIMTTMKQFQELRKAEGRMASWSTSRLVFPQYEQADHHYISTVFTTKVPDIELDTAVEDATLKKMGSNWEKFSSTLNEMSTGVWARVASRLESVGTPAAGTVFRVDYLKIAPGRMNDYLRIEREIYKPIREMQVARGPMTYWALSRVLFPGGENREYDCYTVQAGKDMQALMGGLAMDEALFRKAHPNLSYTQTIASGQETRKLVRNAVYHLLERV